MDNMFALELFSSLEKKQFDIPESYHQVTLKNLDWIGRNIPLDYDDRSLLKVAVAIQKKIDKNYRPEILPVLIR